MDSALNQLIDALRRITQAIRLSSSVVQDTLGITGAQLFVLQQLAETPRASLREIADRTLTDQSSVSVVVSRLVVAGYVSRKTAAADARRTELSLTAAGRAVLRRAPELAQARLMAALRAVPVAQLRVTARVLHEASRAVAPASERTQMFFEPPTGQAREVAARPRAPSRGKARAKKAKPRP
ncbi:MAG TPA: MarR family winged helix-turn-helix transcriptional regulator [Kofleriaceae bacterium]|nr:MarR family winged helix-turn-helix transcriptional regulator [Kofleriaceae bacterium]